MDRTVVSTKGQVALPKEIREKRHWTAGTTLVVEDRPDGVLLRAEGRKKSGSILDLPGVLKIWRPTADARRDGCRDHP